MSNALVVNSSARPWRAVGLGVEHIPSADVLGLAGLDWSVRTVPLVTEDPNGAPIPGYRAVVRSPGETPLGVVGERYQVIQNREMFSFLETILGESSARLDTVGQIGQGKRVWALARLPGAIQVRSDITEKYLLLVNSHDGTSALRVLFTPIRVACSNTLNIALRLGDGISIRHTSGASARIEEARRTLSVADGFYAEFDAVATRLAATRYTDLEMRELATALLPASTEHEPSTRIQGARSRIVELFSEGLEHRSIEGSAWAALNAVAEYADHHRPSRGLDTQARADGRLTSLWFGSGAALKRRAFEHLKARAAA